MSETTKVTEKLPRFRTIEVLYRPVFDVHLNMAIDHYTQLRLMDRSMGIILPETYVPVAEKSRQIYELGKIALEECCDAIKRCEAKEVEIDSLLMWTSVKQLNKKTFFNDMKKIVDKKEISPDKFCFCITQNILPADQDNIKENIRLLRDEGFNVAIDDFGIEYSSLSNLGQYEVDYIGLNECLLENILVDERQQNMVQGIIEFAKKIETRTMVGGIDSVEKETMLKKMGVDRLSGPLYGTYVKEREVK
ncbi:MAG: EAL domain-containing protein [Clostridia bacterium]|nr:EAL domain-containing protein [Clostridia bacterium]